MRQQPINRQSCDKGWPIPARTPESEQRSAGHRAPAEDHHAVAARGETAAIAWPMLVPPPETTTTRAILSPFTGAPFAVRRLVWPVTQGRGPLLGSAARSAA
jgi:hypothetical protein